MMTLTNKNGIFLFYRHVFLEKNQIAFIDTLKGRVKKTTSFYRNLLTNAEPMIIDLSDKELGLNIEINEENYYFKINLSIDKKLEEEIFNSARCQIITEKGIDLDFINPKFKEAIKMTFKKQLKDNKDNMINNINAIMKESEDYRFLNVKELYIFKEHNF